MFRKDRQYVRFCTYGFLKNLRLFEPFLILFLNHEGISYTQIGILYAIREIARNLFEIPGGVFADAFGRKKSLLLAFSVYLLSFISFYLSGSFWSFVVAFLLYAFGDAFRTGTHKAIIMSYLEENNWSDYKIDYYGHTRSWSQLGSALSALLAGFTIFLTKDYKLAFLISLFPYTLELINLASYPKSLDRPHSQDPLIRLGLQLRQTVRDFISSIQNGKVFKPILSLSAYTGYYKASKDYIQPLIQSFAISLPFLQKQESIEREAILIGIVYFLLYLSTSFVSRRSGLWVRKQRSNQYAMLKSLIIGASSGIISGILIMLGYKVPAILFFTGIFLFENLRKPIGIGQIVENLDQKVLASALSVESQAETVFAALFAVILGFMVEEFSLAIGLITVSVLAVLPAMVIKSIK
ncbi:MAG: MFS transporter [Bacteroidales bacterium]|nr:MFS transporter [Bacteroidales bacterium]